MKKYILFLFAFLSMSISLQSQNDFFPLKIGNQWNYSYKSVEKQFLDISFMSQMSIDSGSIHYSITDSYNQDSMVIWKIQEHDIIERRIQDYYYNTDTTYSINVNTTFQLCEYLDSAHTLKSESYYEVFTFPVKWDSFGSISSTTPITRFNPDSSVLIIKENIFLIASYSDSLIFHKDIGLVYAQSTIYKGPNVPYLYKWEASLSSFLTGVNFERIEIPNRFVLFQNHPNPFNPETNIKFTISERTKVTLTVYDLMGQVLIVLVDEEKNPGEYKIKFTPNNVSSGIFIYQLKTPLGVTNKKMMYIK